MPNLNRSQATADMMIKRWGKSGFLIRNQGTPTEEKRPCRIARAEYSPKDRESIAVDGIERLFISSKNLTVPPDYTKDVVQYNGNFYRITMDVSGPRPNGLVIYYDCPCVFVGLAA